MFLCACSAADETTTQKQAAQQKLMRPEVSEGEREGEREHIIPPALNFLLYFVSIPLLSSIQRDSVSNNNEKREGIKNWLFVDHQ